MAAGRRPVRQGGMSLLLWIGSASSVPDQIHQKFISTLYAVFRSCNDNCMNPQDMPANRRSMRAHGNLAADGKVWVIDSAAIKTAAAAACDVGCCSCSMPSPLPAKIRNSTGHGAASVLALDPVRQVTVLACPQVQHTTMHVRNKVSGTLGSPKYLRMR